MPQDPFDALPYGPPLPAYAPPEFAWRPFNVWDQSTWPAPPPDPASTALQSNGYVDAKGAFLVKYAGAAYLARFRFLRNGALEWRVPRADGELPTILTTARVSEWARVPGLEGM